MKTPRVLTLILAGGAGGRLDVLTEKRAKPALPFGGTLRLIDFSLSNCLHSGLTDVWVIEQYQLHSLNNHLANGRPWDLDRTRGGLQVLPPYVEDDGAAAAQGGFAKGNADAIYRQRRLIREFAPDLILVLSADHVYKLDYRDVIERHRVCAAAVTMVTTRVPPGDSASRFGVVEVAADGRVTGFAYKPEKPRGDLVTAEVFVYDAKRLLDEIDAIFAQNGALKDYGDELLPRMVKRGHAWEFRLESYWRDVGTPESYWQAHMDLLDRKDELALDDPAWPILTYGHQSLPAHLLENAVVQESLLAPGCTVDGNVRRSVLAPGVVVERGARVEDSVVLQGAHIGPEASVRKAVLDENVRIGYAAVIGGGDEISIVGSGACVAASARVQPGKHVLPGAGTDQP